MQYPRPIKIGDTIGITAPSAGITNEIKQARLDYAKENLEKRGYKTIETKHVREDKQGKSAPTKVQMKEMEELLTNDDVSLIVCATGGDFQIETLSETNWEMFLKHPKWIQGYSDPTNLLYVLTTKYNLATVYASNAANFGMQPWHNSLENNLKILEGETVIQTNFEYYEKESIPYLTGKEGYNLDTPVEYQLITKENHCKITGRLIGGCLDCLLNICGTKFDATKEFINRYKEDGIIWYFDNAELSMESLIRGLWQLKNSGWFKYTKAFLFGRMNETSYYGINQKEAILRVLKEFEVPIITQMDFGHIPPRITLINGSLASITYQENKMTLEMTLGE